jgi:hypothetical protein
MSIVVYLLKVSLALLLCWALYWTTFKRLTFFQWNRFYLLASVVLSLIVPLLKLQWNTTMVAVADIGGIDWTYVNHLTTQPVAFTEQANMWSPGTVLLTVYLAVALSLLVRSAARFRYCLLQMVFHLSFPSPLCIRKILPGGIIMRPFTR